MRKVWTYLSSKSLSEAQTQDLLAAGNAFVKSWTAHDIQLSASFELYKNRILVVSVDEDLNNASGCSIDKLLRFVKDCEKQFETELLNRLLVAIDTEQGIEVLRSSEVSSLLQSGKLTAQSKVYNLAVSNERELTTWLQPLSSTWLNKYLAN